MLSKERHQTATRPDFLANARGSPPEKVFVVAPWSDYQPQEYRFADYAAYFRRVKAAAEMHQPKRFWLRGLATAI
jgi:uncharacterized protein